jgi:hypothetical protein
LQLFVLEGSRRSLFIGLYGVQPKGIWKEDAVSFSNSVVFGILRHVLFSAGEGVRDGRSSAGTITKAEVEFGEDMGPTNLPFREHSLRHEGL